ncbi:MAG: aminotransferase class IV, partial [Planctomycetota bacterium]
ERQRVRLSITGGDLNLLSSESERVHDPTVLVSAQPATAYPDAMFEQGVVVAIADAKANPFEPTASHKTLNYWWRLSALRDASVKGAAEALVFQVTNHLCGGCVSNAFVVKDGSLLTPIARGEEAAGALPSPVLPGITRGAVVDAARELGIDVTARMLTIDDVLGADELFLTNSSWGVLPVVAVEASKIGGGEVGETTRALRERLIDEPPA